MTGKLSIFPGSALIGGSALIRILAFSPGSAFIGASALIRIPRVRHASLTTQASFMFGRIAV